jgi:pyruvyl transferase EpsO
MNNDIIVARQVKLLMAALRKVVAPGERYSLVDFPDHSNVGDSAIWLGGVKALKEVTGRRPSYVASKSTYDASRLAKSHPDGPIFIHGGGNFGDLYPEHQQLRIDLMRDFPKRRIIQLPQSLSFSDEAVVARTAKAIKEHENFYLFVRDSDSKLFAERHFDCPVEQAPDCALALESLLSDRVPTDHFIFLRRTDKETSGADYSGLEVLKAPEYDWLVEPKMPVRVRLLAKVARVTGSDFVRFAHFNLKASVRVKRGVDLLSSGEAVITDRLHGYIMSVLLRRPVVAMDNSTKKVSAYHNLWMSDADSAAVVTNTNAALDALITVRMCQVRTAISGWGA